MLKKARALRRSADAAPWRDRHKGRTWKVYVIERAAWLEDDLKVAKTGPRAKTREGRLTVVSCQEHLADAKRTLEGEFWRNISNWFTGYGIERAWAALHAVQSQLLLIQSDDAVRARIPEIRAALLRIDKDDPRRVDSEVALQTAAKPAPLGDDVRYALRQANESAFEEIDAVFGRIRGFRNALLGAILVLVVGLALTALFSSSDWLPLCAPCAASVKQCPPCPEVWQVYLVGGLAGLLAAVVALRRLEGFRGPYSLPLVQAALKVPTGALTGLIGAIFVQSSVFDLFKPQPGNQILAYVALFGYAQEVFTRFVDERAAKIAAPVVPPDDKSKQ